MAKRNWKIIFATAIAAIIITTLFLLGIALAIEPKTSISGVTVMDESFSGLSVQDCEVKLQQLSSEVKKMPITVRYLDKEWEIYPDDIGLDLDKEYLIREIMMVGRRGSIFQRIRDYRQARYSGIEILPKIIVQQDKLENELRNIAEQVASSPSNAFLKINPDDTVDIVPSRDGITVDINAAFQDITEQYKNYNKKPEIELVLISSKPEITTEDVMMYGVESLIASYTTYFNSADYGRSYNIKVAAKALDEVLIAPGEIFSFNKVVGPRSSESGYKNAKVIINNEFVDGLGGGVCQVSSTLYNAVLLAGLGIVERSNHSLPVSYVPEGRDATVAYEIIDFRFKNTSSKHIYMKTMSGAGGITIKIYGNNAAKKQITLRTKVLARTPFKEIMKYDPDLEKGASVIKRHGIQGMVVMAERLIRENGSYRIERLPESSYHPLDQIVVKGTAAKPPEPLNPGESDVDENDIKPEMDGSQKPVTPEDIAIDGDLSQPDSENTESPLPGSVPETEKPDVSENIEESTTEDEDGVSR